MQLLVAMSWDKMGGEKVPKPEVGGAVGLGTLSQHLSLQGLVALGLFLLSEHDGAI